MYRLFLLLITTGSIGAAAAIALIAALKKRFRNTHISTIAAIVIAALYGAALVLTVISVIYGTSLIGAALSAPGRTELEATTWRLS